MGTRQQLGKKVFYIYMLDWGGSVRVGKTYTSLDEVRKARDKMQEEDKITYYIGVEYIDDNKEQGSYYV